MAIMGPLADGGASVWATWSRARSSRVIEVLWLENREIKELVWLKFEKQCKVLQFQWIDGPETWLTLVNGQGILFPISAI